MLTNFYLYLFFTFNWRKKFKKFFSLPLGKPSNLLQCNLIARMKLTLTSQDINQETGKSWETMRALRIFTFFSVSSADFLFLCIPTIMPSQFTVPHVNSFKWGFYIELPVQFVQQFFILSGRCF